MLVAFCGSLTLEVEEIGFGAGFGSIMGLIASASSSGKLVVSILKAASGVTLGLLICDAIRQLGSKKHLGKEQVGRHHTDSTGEPSSKRVMESIYESYEE